MFCGRLTRRARKMDADAAELDDAADMDDDDAAVEAAAEERMASIHRGFASAKAKGVQAAARLMKEMRQARGPGLLPHTMARRASRSSLDPRPPIRAQVCLAGSFEVGLVDDDLLLWEVCSHKPRASLTQPRASLI